MDAFREQSQVLQTLMSLGIMGEASIISTPSSRWI